MNARKAVLADNPELILRVLQLRCNVPGTSSSQKYSVH